MYKCTSWKKRKFYCYCDCTTAFSTNNQGTQDEKSNLLGITSQKTGFNVYAIATVIYTLQYRTMYAINMHLPHEMFPYTLRLSVGWTWCKTVAHLTCSQRWMWRYGQQVPPKCLYLPQETVNFIVKKLVNFSSGASNETVMKSFNHQDLLTVS